jgi:hypothetical protein
MLPKRRFWKEEPTFQNHNSRVKGRVRASRVAFRLALTGVRVPFVRDGVRVDISRVVTIA